MVVLGFVSLGRPNKFLAGVRDGRPQTTILFGEARSKFGLAMAYLAEA